MGCYESKLNSSHNLTLVINLITYGVTSWPAGSIAARLETSTMPLICPISAFLSLKSQPLAAKETETANIGEVSD